MLTYDLDRIYDIIEEAENLLSWYNKYSFYNLENDLMLQRAIERSFEIMGEAVKGISKQLRDSYPHIPWTYMAKMRDKIIHRYFETDVYVLWTTIEKDIPDLLKDLKALAKELESKLS